MHDPHTTRAPQAILRLALLPLTVATALLGAGCNTAEAERERNLLEIYTNTAESYYQLGDHDRAVGQAIKALEIEPDDTKVKLILAWSLQRRGSTQDVQRAERVFREVIDEDDEDFRAPLGLATSLERQGLAHDEAAQSIESGKRVTEARDPVARAAELRTRAQELWSESVTWYERTLELQTSNLDALNGLQRVEALLGRPEKSLERSTQLIQALVTDRGYWEAQEKRVQLGEREEREIRRTIGQIVDLEVATRMHAARIEFQQGRAALAMEHLDTAIGLSPTRADLFGMRAVVQQSLSKWDDAIADAEKFIALSSSGYDSPDITRAYDLIHACQAQKKENTP